MSYIGNEPVISATRTITEIVATAGQTTFTANGGYTVGYVDVFVNGAQLQLTDFTATNGSTVALTQAATANDDVRIVAWGTFGVASLDGSNLVNSSVTPAKLSQPFTAGTSVASTSGTAIDFTNIPSWVKRITIMLNGVSTGGTSNLIVQLGDSGGIEQTGYSSVCTYAGGTNEAAGSTQTGGLLLTSNISTASQVYGTMILNTFGNNTWFATGTTGYNISSLSAYVMSFVGAKTLSATLDRVRITSVSSDTFDLGSINILYE